MANRWFTKIFGTRFNRELKRIQPIVDAIHEHEVRLKEIGDSELQAQTAKFREAIAQRTGALHAEVERLKQAKHDCPDPAERANLTDQLRKAEQEFVSELQRTLDDLLPEAFATVREAARRLLGSEVVVTGHAMKWDMVPYDVQLIGGIVLHQGKIAEMATGEGKTLVATLPLYLNALAGRGAHLVTVNNYLARRDSQWMGHLFTWLGLTVGCIDDTEPGSPERRQAYLCDITYGTNNEFGFDYLRDNMVISPDHRVQRGHAYAIIDEVDSILIDEAPTPLILSGPLDDRSDFYNTIDTFFPKLDKSDYEVDEKQRTVTLTEAGMEKIETLLRDADLLKGESLYDVENVSVVHHINQALRAHTLFQRDKDYIVRDGEVIIIDEFTGRMMPGRRYSEGLHQALEAKEHQPVQPENQTLASITFQNYFRMYEKRAGMTGTAAAEAGERFDIYQLEVVEIPTNVAVARLDEDDEVYRTQKEKYAAILAEVERANARLQPGLVGTASIEKSEVLADYLKQHGYKQIDFGSESGMEKLYAAARAGKPAKLFAVLNARFHEQEAYIAAEAGVPA